MGKKKFKTEVQQLLDLVIHSLYSNKEIFLRELISNSSDAIDRRRFEGLKDKAIASDDGGRIQIIPDSTLGTLTIRDNGIGMSSAEVEKNIGTIASSGTKAFMEELRKGKSSDNAELIGQFGVGFYASFMVADRVEVYTRRAGSDAADGVHWVSKGDGSYTIDACEREQVGTDVIVHLREAEETLDDDGETDRVDYGEYLEEWKIKKVVKQYSDFVDYPIVMDITREDRPRDENGEPIEGVDPIVTTNEETLNSMKAIWTRSKSDVSDEDYSEFYRHLTHAYDEPLKTIHFTAEGMVEFSALLYLPTKAPFDLYMPDQGRRGLHLYVKRVFIMDDCKDLLPDYMRFVRGVVQCNDLPLNVSREILQENAVVRRIHKSLTGKVLGALKSLKDKEREKYVVWYNEFGKVLKEGLHHDFANKEKLQELILFQSSTTETGTVSSLREYVDRMPEGQEAIYYITGDSREAVESSPHLEIFREKGYEVLFLTDPIDEWVVQSLTHYDEKALTAIDRGDIDLGTEEEKEEKKKEREEAEEEYAEILEMAKGRLSDHVSDVRLSSRLTDSAGCLVADGMAMNAHMERIFRSMNQDAPASKRILELNPTHPILNIMKQLHSTSADHPKLGDYVDLIFNQALLAEGSDIQDPQRFARIVNDLMVFEGQAVASDS